MQVLPNQGQRTLLPEEQPSPSHARDKAFSTDTRREVEALQLEENAERGPRGSAGLDRVLALTPESCGLLVRAPATTYDLGAVRSSSHI